MLDVIVEGGQVALDARQFVRAPQIEATLFPGVDKCNGGEILLISGTGCCHTGTFEANLKQARPIFAIHEPTFQDRLCIGGENIVANYGGKRLAAN